MQEANEIVIDSIAETEKPKKLTDSEYHKLMKMYFTVEHGTVKTCGHKLDLNVDPRHRNCDDCWFAYFQNNGQMTATCVELVEKHTYKALIALRGYKFAEKFFKFISYVEALKNDLEAGKKLEGINVTDGDTGEAQG